MCSKNMIYTSPKGKQIIFDDFTDNTEEYGSYWVEMCPRCHSKYRGILGNRADDGGTARGTCSVKGCANEANYYVDFNKDEVEFSDLPCICNYFDYRDMTEKLFDVSVPHLNDATEQIRQYLVNGGSGKILEELKIGIRVVTKRAVLLPDEEVKRRFIWLNGEQAGKELTIDEIKSIGMFLKNGPFEQLLENRNNISSYLPEPSV